MSTSQLSDFRMRLIVYALAVAVGACHGQGPLEVGGAPSRTLYTSVGRELHLTLGTVGPGEYSSPPVISGGAVQFVDMAHVGPSTPGGVQQMFRLRAVATGLAVVHFQHTDPARSVDDTIVVR